MLTMNDDHEYGYCYIKILEKITETEQPVINKERKMMDFCGEYAVEYVISYN